MSRSAVVTLILFFLTASFIITPLSTNADPRTIIVPDDYPTISSAIGNATDGDIIFVQKGTYQIPTNQTLTIHKSISLIGEDTENTIISLNPGYNVTYILTTPFFDLANAIIVDANDVKLSGFTISIASPGGYISVTGDRIEIIGNNLKTGGSTTGLRVSGSHCNITDNISEVRFQVHGSFNYVAQNYFFGIFLDGDSNTISNNSCTYVNLGHYMPCLYNIISGNRVESRTRSYSGISVENSAHNVIYANCISGFSFGVELDMLAENNTFYHNNFADSLTAHISVSEGELFLSNFWDNSEEGNYWDDYNGTDGNRDGIGDTPNVIDANNQDNYPLMFPFDIENNTVVLPPPEPFPTTIVIASVVTVAAVGVGLFVYFRKRKHRTGTAEVR
jgi:hypothetical protein